MQEKEIFNGTNGTLWIQTEAETIEIASVQSFSVTQTNDYEEYNSPNEYGKYQKFLGYSLAGTLTKYKIGSEMINILYEYAKGNQQDIYIIGKVENPSTGKLQRIKYSNVTIDSGDLQNFELKTATKEEIPFKAAKYEFLDNQG